MNVGFECTPDYIRIHNSDETVWNSLHMRQPDYVVSKDILSGLKLREVKYPHQDQATHRHS